MSGLTLTYYRDPSGKMPAPVAAQVQKVLSEIPDGQKIALCIAPAPPFADAMEPTERIEAILTWYAMLPFDFADPETLVNYSRLLSCAIADLAILAGQLRKATNAAEFRRKAHHATRCREIMATQDKPNVSAAVAQTESEAAYLNLRESEAQTSGDSDAATLILRHSSDVLDTMRQQISMLRREREDERFGRGTQNA